MKQFLLLLTLAASFFTSAFASDGKYPVNYHAERAEEYINLGLFDDALGYALQEIADYDDNANGYYQAAICHYGLNRPEKSLSMLTEALKHSAKDRKLAVRCRILQAAVYEEMGDTLKVLEAVGKGLKLDAHNPDLLVAHGRMIMAENPDKAFEDFNKVKKTDPTNIDAYTYTAAIYMGKNEYRKALDEIMKAIELDPDSAYCYAFRGLILKNLGYSPDWIRDCLRSTGLDNESVFGPTILAGVESQEERSAIISELERTKTHDNGYYPLQANLLYEWQLYEEAAEVLAEIISLRIADPMTYAMLADCREKQFDVMEAYAVISKGLELFPADMTLKLSKALIGIEVGKADEVMDIIDELISADPQMADTYNVKGIALLTKGRYAEACEPLSTACSLSHSPIYKLNYGDALRLAGNTGQAEKEYMGILDYTENQILEEGEYPQRLYAMAYSSLGMKDKAMEYAGRFYSEYPEEDPSVLLRVYSRLGEKEKAIELLKENADTNGWNAAFDLYTVDFFPLHTEKAFADLVEQQGIDIRFNEETRLLEPDMTVATFSSDATSLEEFSKTISTITDPAELMKKIKEMCPIDMGMFGQISDININEKKSEIIYNVTLPYNTMNIDALNANPEYKEKKLNMMALGFLSQGKQLSDWGFTVTYIFRNPGNDKKIELSISPKRMKDLEKIASSQDEIDRMLIDLWLEEDNSRVSTIAGYDTEVSAGYDTRFYSYIFPVSEKDFLSNELFLSDIKKTFIGLLKDPVMNNRIKILSRNGIGFKVIFKNKENGRTQEIAFPADELKELLNGSQHDTPIQQ